MYYGNIFSYLTELIVYLSVGVHLCGFRVKHNTLTRRAFTSVNR